MKFVSLITRCADRGTTLDKPFHAAHESSAKPRTVHHQICTFAELRQQIHDDLRVQHPEWVQPDGKSPMCDSYEARLAELIGSLTPSESSQSIPNPYGLLEEGAN